METVTVESIPIVVGREEDGRWWADIESMPGVMAYGDTRDLAIAAVRALALRVAADCIDHGEDVPRPFAQVFSIAGADRPAGHFANSKNIISRPSNNLCSPNQVLRAAALLSA